MLIIVMFYKKSLDDFLRENQMKWNYSRKSGWKNCKFNIDEMFSG